MREARRRGLQFRQRGLPFHRVTCDGEKHRTNVDLDSGLRRGTQHPNFVAHPEWLTLEQFGT
jgi:hypothetical protein